MDNPRTEANPSSQVSEKFEAWAEEDLKLFAHGVRCGTVNRVGPKAPASNARGSDDAKAWELDTRIDSQAIANQRVKRGIYELVARNDHAHGIADLVCWVYFDQKPIQEFMVRPPFSVRKRSLKEFGTHFEAAGLIRDLVRIVARIIQEESLEGKIAI